MMHDMMGGGMMWGMGLFGLVGIVLALPRDRRPGQIPLLPVRSAMIRIAITFMALSLRQPGGERAGTRAGRPDDGRRTRTEPQGSRPGGSCAGDHLLRRHLPGHHLGREDAGVPGA